MSNNLARVERVAASDARFAWAKNVEFAIFGLENDFADDVDIAAGEMVHYRPWDGRRKSMWASRATRPSIRSVY
ncbi:Hypothetical protein ERS075659_00426 [Mycobacteroides abscessus]|nr:Hypothetical protein ERS075659_00426 [Mycobacteroides abscessus]